MKLADWDIIEDVSASALGEIEERTFDVGRQLFGNLDAYRPGVLHRRWWDERLMRWAMRDESVRDRFPFVGTMIAI
jgi:RHH-type proline utilization regulon transcriptional repressor/proline dehydrogenase/delta 1-pyrroline-5-carboxylate dehydrogenase